MTFGFDAAPLLAALGVCAQIVMIDLLLSADNALVIALACRALPPERMRIAAALGTAGAIALRIAMAAGVIVLLDVPYLKIVAGVTLLAIAVRMTLGPGAPEVRSSRGTLLNAVLAIIVADAVMSLDNVVAIAALAQGSVQLMAFGLALSVPLLISGSALIRHFLDANALLVWLSGMFLGWTAGQIGADDAAVAPWIAASAPGLTFAVPAACAIFVLWEGRILTNGQASRRGLDAG